MSNPFDDLESEDDDTAPDTTPRKGPSESEDVAGSDPEREIADTLESDPSETGPAFEYSAVRQKPLYARGETWDEFEKTFRTTIAPKLAEADVVDEETRELHDALVKLGIEQPERIAELMLEARRDS
ncbi:hypothetical protein [Natrinema ejinorense]|uniref:Uncharacterized protein n=1 Tax=Natrinema ejinorense TaxID=373386 RepID=A0A2A5QP99_9EURY|nr:hypothetical protein [Natrinema ejinorense]PCR88644.1 hypothetical protein CP557_21670 [Natrinema ejinorense]